MLPLPHIGSRSEVTDRGHTGGKSPGSFFRNLENLCLTHYAHSDTMTMMKHANRGGVEFPEKVSKGNGTEGNFCRVGRYAPTC